jgi:hypothetical protein
VEAVHATGSLLQDLGHIVEEVPLPYDEWEVLRAAIILGATNTAAVVSDLEVKYGRSKVRGSLEDIPLHRTENELPVGVQFLGRFGDEVALLRLAAQLEQAKPWPLRT